MDSQFTWDSLLKLSSVNDYLETCRIAGVGPSGLICKCDRAITALRYVQMTTVSPRDAATTSEIKNAIDRLERWKVPLRKARKRQDVPRMAEGREQHYDLTRLTAITKCTTMWQEFEQISSSATRRPLSTTELRVATAAMAATILFNSAQRPSAIMGLTIDEVDRRRWSDGVWVMSVREHKTREKGPAMLTLSPEDLDRLMDYIKHIRVQIDPTGALPQILLKPGTPPQPYTSLQPLLKFLETRYNVTIPSATKYRKAVASKAAAKCTDTEVSSIAQSMSHSMQILSGTTTNSDSCKSLQDTH